MRGIGGAEIARFVAAYLDGKPRVLGALVSPAMARRHGIDRGSLARAAALDGKRAP
jgi:hypothetical protein